MIFSCHSPLTEKFRRNGSRSFKWKMTVCRLHYIFIFNKSYLLKAYKRRIDVERLKMKNIAVRFIYLAANVKLHVKSTNVWFGFIYFHFRNKTKHSNQHITSFLYLKCRWHVYDAIELIAQKPQIKMSNQMP